MVCIIDMLYFECTFLFIIFGYLRQDSQYSFHRSQFEAPQGMLGNIVITHDTCASVIPVAVPLWSRCVSATHLRLSHLAVPAQVSSPALRCVRARTVFL